MFKVFCLYDVKAGFYLQPQFFTSVGQATRALQDLASDPSNTVGRHPGDFQLFQFGEWDEFDGMFHVHAPEHVCSADALLVAKPGS